MPALLEKWAGVDHAPIAAERSLSFDQYLSLVTSFTYNGMGYTTGSTTMPGGDFEQLVQQVHHENNVISAIVVTRGLLMKQLRFAYRNNRRTDPNYRQLFGNTTLERLERPDPGVMTRPHWLTAKEYHESYAGVGVTINRGDHFQLASPDCIDVVLAGVDDAETVLRRKAGRKIGYVHYPEGRDRPETAEALRLEEVAHWVPEPDPVAWWTGKSWVLSVLQEIVTDRAATKYLQQFFDKAATPNLIVKPHERLDPAQIDEYREVFTKETAGVNNAFKTMWLGGGSDVQVVGSSLKDLDIKNVSGAGEARMAMRGRVPAVILGIREGMQGSALNSGNYNAARRMLADGFYTPQSQDLCASLESIVPPPSGSELWFDPADALFLQEDAKDEAEIMAKKSAALQALDSAGYDADAAVKAIRDNNLSALLGNHDGLQSVQRLPTEDSGDSDE